MQKIEILKFEMTEKQYFLSRKLLMNKIVRLENFPGNAQYKYGK